MNRHLSDDELLDRLCGLTENGGHLDSCGECARRWSEMRARRAEFAAGGELLNDFFAAQRRRIYARLGEEPRAQQMKWIPAVAAACLLAVGVFLYRPATPSAPSRPQMSDAQLFSEVYSMGAIDRTAGRRPDSFAIRG